MIRKKVLVALLSTMVILQTLSPALAMAEEPAQREFIDLRESLKKERAADAKEKKKTADEAALSHKPQRQKGIQVQSLDGDTPSMVSGKLSEKQYRKESEILSFLDEKKQLFKLREPKKELAFKRKTVDKKNNSHYRFQQKVGDIPVYGAELIVHADPKGSVYAYNAQYHQPEKIRVKTSAGISFDRAVKSAISFVEKSEKVLLSPNAAGGSSKGLVIYPFKNSYYLAYQIQLSYRAPEPGRWKVFVDAQSGNIIHGYNMIAEAGPVTATGVGYFGESRNLQAYQGNAGYLLKDMTRGQAVIDTYDFRTENNVSDPDGHFIAPDQRTAVDAHYFGGIVYDYFNRNFQRLSYDDKNSPIPMYVHVEEDGEPMNNAYWDGTGLWFGDGDGEFFSPLSSQLDVVAHEFAHGVTEHSAGLEYYGQSGALNESVSDIFGALIEENWLIGEDVFTPDRDGDALRNMENPAAEDQPEHMRDYFYTLEDNGGVHTNSGIPNRAAFLIADTLENQGINGKERLGQITYWALTNYLLSTSDFNDARDGFLLAAQTLYGNNSPEYAAVNEAWSSVGIPYEEVPPVLLEDPYEVNNTHEQARAITLGTYKPSLGSNDDQDWFKIEVAKDSDMVIHFGDYEVRSNGPYTMDIYDENMILINQVDSELLGSDGDLSFFGGVLVQPVQAGTYYLKVYSDYAVTGTVPYLFTVGQDGFEPNNLPEQATPLAMGDDIQSYLSYFRDVDYYQLDVTDNQNVNISLSELPGDYDLLLYRSGNMNEPIAYSINGQDISEMISVPLIPGSYMVKVVPIGFSTSLVPYRLTVNTGIIHEYDSQFTWVQDYVVASDGSRAEVLVDVQNIGSQSWESGQFYLGVAEGSDISGEDSEFQEEIPLSFGEIWLTSIHLQAPEQVGDYIIPLQMYHLNASGQKEYFGDVVEVNLKVVEDPTEPNNWYTEARPISGGDTIISNVSFWADHDYYTFTIDEAQDVTVNLFGMGADYDLYLDGDDGEAYYEIASSKNLNTENESFTVRLMPGTYYIVVWAYDYAENGDQSYHLYLDAQTATPLPGDFDGDGDTDSGDFSLLKDHYGATNVTETGMDIHDGQASQGMVDLFDIISWTKKYGP